MARTEEQKAREREYDQRRRGDPAVRERHREYMRKHLGNPGVRERKRERDRERRRDPAYRERQRERHRERDRERRRDPAYRERQRERKRRGNHITPETEAKILAAQGGVCGSCKRAEPGGAGHWHADHDHETGAIRGLLCTRCNTGIGMLGDSAEGLRRALNYLENVAPRNTLIALGLE